jgi:hypothetical protein
MDREVPPALGRTLRPLDRAIAGMEGGMPETFEQLDELLVILGTSMGIVRPRFHA